MRSWRFNQAQGKLEHDLARIIETANGHHAKGQPKGSPVYFSLRDQANAKINAFCEKWTVERKVIEAQAPALKDLYTLTVADKQVSPLLKLLGMLLGGLLSLILIGMASGAIHAGHNWAFHLLSH
jgi:Mlc titration factor MtfA (ptsG expression regulator)